MSTYVLVEGKYQKVENLAALKKSQHERNIRIKGNKLIPENINLKVKKLKYKENRKANSHSPAETRIANILKQYKVKFIREVEFNGLANTQGIPYRFDFYIPRLKLVIEYDGSGYHADISTRQRDEYKNKFCRANGIRIVRFTKNNWHSLEADVIRVCNYKNKYKKKAYNKSR